MIVLDASAVVDVVLDRAGKAWVLDQLDGVRVVVPAHQPAEVLSAVARLVRAGATSQDAAREALTAASRLPQHAYPTTFQHQRRAFELSDRIRVADGLYVALAEELGCPVVTTDRRLAGAEPPCEVRHP